MSIHEQAALYGSLANVDTPWSSTEMLELITTHLELGTYQAHPGWQDRLINNYFQCLINKTTDNLSAIHYGANGRHILLRIFDVISKSGSSTFDILAAIYLGQLKDIQAGIITEDVKGTTNVATTSGKLTGLLFDVYGRTMFNDTLRDWHVASHNHTTSTSVKLVVLGRKPKAESKRTPFSTDDFALALMVDNLQVLTDVPRAPSVSKSIVQRAKHLLTHAPLYWTKVKQWYVPQVRRLCVTLGLEDVKELSAIPNADELIQLPPVLPLQT